MVSYAIPKEDEGRAYGLQDSGKRQRWKRILEDYGRARGRMV